MQVGVFFSFYGKSLRTTFYLQMHLVNHQYLHTLVPRLLSLLSYYGYLLLAIGDWELDVLFKPGVAITSSEWDK